jgi:hypothetical protein
MAETGTAAPSYSLSGYTQRAVQQAGVGGEAQEHLAKSVGADAIQGVVAGIKDQIVEKQEDTAAREEAWDVGFDAMGDRGSWASGDLYDQFQFLEAGYKDEYLEAVRTGDKKAQARMLKDQATRASGLKGWKETMETAKQINDSPGGWADSLGDDEKEILKALTKLDGKTAITRFSDKGEMVFDITLPDGRMVTKTRREVDEMVGQGVYPAELELQIIKANKAQVQNGLEGGLFDLEGTASEIALSMTDDQLPALMNQKWKFGGGGTFRDHIKSHPDFKAAYADGGFMSSMDPTPDGELTSADMAEFSPSDMDLIIDEMEKDPKTARGYVADWMSRIQEQNHQKGVDEKTRLEEEERRRNAPKLTSYERNLNRAERDRLDIIETRKKPIMVGGKNFGLVKQYEKDEKGFWRNNSIVGDDGKGLKIRDMQLGIDVDVLEAELERLQVKTPTTKSAQDLLDEYSEFS